MQKNRNSKTSIIGNIIISPFSQSKYILEYHTNMSTYLNKKIGTVKKKKTKTLVWRISPWQLSKKKNKKQTNKNLRDCERATKTSTLTSKFFQRKLREKLSQRATILLKIKVMKENVAWCIYMLFRLEYITSPLETFAYVGSG